MEIGIDFGTTNTVVSYINRQGDAKPIRIMSDTIIPSVIYYNSRDSFDIGKIAKQKAEAFPEASVTDFKIFLGDENKKFKIKTKRGITFNVLPYKVASQFLSEVFLKAQDAVAREYRNTPEKAIIDKVIITIPVKFERAAINELKKAVKEAGIPQVALMSEPSAAAIAYMDQHSNMVGGNILVYDFGGGTFDVSLMHRNNSRYDLIDEDGMKIGGNNLTNEIIQDMLESINYDFDGIEMTVNEEDFDEVNSSINRDFYIENLHIIRENCEKIKRDLSSGSSLIETGFYLITSIDNEGNPSKDYVQYSYSCDDIYKLINKHIDKTVEKTKSVLKTAKQNKIKIDRLVLAGGSSQIPSIKTKLEKMIQELSDEDANAVNSSFYSNIPVMRDDDVSTLISIGAAIKAHKNYSGVTLMDKNVADVGVKTQLGNLIDRFETIVPAGTMLPCTRTKKFSLDKIENNCLEIYIYERDVQNWNKIDNTVRNSSVSFIDKIMIPGINIEKNPDASVSIAFELKRDGSIDVKANVTIGDRVIGKDLVIKRESERDLL